MGICTEPRTGQGHVKPHTAFPNAIPHGKRRLGRDSAVYLRCVYGRDRFGIFLITP